MSAPHPPFRFRPAGGQPHATADGRGPRLVATGAVTDGEFGLFEITLPPGASSVPHFHTGFSESFHVLDGTVRFRLGDHHHDAGPGDFAFIPRRGVHGFANAGDAEARMLIVFVPGAPREDYFAELAELHDRDTPPTDAEIDALAARHDQVNIRDLPEPPAR